MARSDDLSTSLPNFFVLGAAKAGTTTLHALLSQHRDVFMSKRKEPHFFDDDRRYAEGLERYAAVHFGWAAAGSPARGEATPSYLHQAAKVAPRMAQAYRHQQPRFITILRDPVARAYSHYRDRLRAGAERESFDDALRLEPERLARSPDSWTGYFRDGHYSGQLETFFVHFPRETFLILRFEQLTEDPGSVTRSVFAFLGVDPEVRVTVGGVRNAAATPRSQWLRDALVQPAAWKSAIKWLMPARFRRDLKRAALRRNLRADINPPLSQDTARDLRDRYGAEFDRLESLLGWDLSTWRAPKAQQSSA